MNQQWDDADYLADKPKLRAAIAALEAAVPQLERLEREAADADAARAANYAACLEQSKARFALYGVEKWSDLPADALAEHRAMWAEAETYQHAEQAAAKAKTLAFEAAARLFQGVEDESVTRLFRWGGYHGWSVQVVRDMVSHLHIKVAAGAMRAAFYAAKRAGIGDVRVGHTVFFPHPRSELRRVVKITPSGMVDAVSLHSGSKQRYTVRSWPAEARRVTRAMAREALALSAEWKRRMPGKGDVA